MKFSDCMTIAEAAKQHGVNYHTARYRVKKKRVTTIKRGGAVWIKRSDARKVCK